MKIRDIRLEQFAAWEHVQIPSLDAGLNVIFLDDDARAIDFSRFLHGLLTGFEHKRGQTNAGSITFVCRTQETRKSKPRNQVWRLDRHARRSGRQSWQIQIDNRQPSTDITLLRELVGGLQSDHLERLFVPTSDIDGTSKAERWNWLAGQKEICSALFAADGLRSGVANSPTLREMANVPLTAHGRVLEDLGKQRDALVEKIATCRATVSVEAGPVRNPQPQVIAPPQVTVPPARVRLEVPKPAPNNQRHLIADIQEELRQLGLQLPPLKLATELADRWRELKSLSRETGTESESRADLDRMKATLSEYQLLEDEKKDYRKTLAKPQRTTRSTGRRSDERTVRRLLEQRDWVTQACARPVSAYDVTSDQHDELRHAGNLLQSSRRDHERAHRRLADFARRTSFDWSKLFEDPIAKAKSEIASHSPLHRESPESRLTELKRRRLWVREDHRSLTRQQTMLPQIHTGLAILVTLSICAILGTLLATTSTAQWLMLAFGLGGLVSSGALKLSLELRFSQKLNRAQDRLRRIDGEVLSLTEEIMSDKQDAATLRRRAEERIYAIQIQEDANESSKRLDSAEASFRELLDTHGLPLHLSPNELERTLQRRKPKSIRSGSASQQEQGNSRLRKWIKKARDTVERLDGIRPGKDPIDILSTLEMLFDRLRDETHTNGESNRNEVDSQFARQIRNDARKQLRLLEKRQRTLLRRFKVEDQFALESAIETLDLAQQNRVRAERLRRELSISIDLHDDPEDVRDLLEAFDGESLQARLSEATRRQKELRSELTRVQSSMSHPRVEHEAEARVEEYPTDSVQQKRTEVEAVDATLTTQNPATQRPRTQPPVSPQSIELDKLRLELAVVETKIRKAIRWSQSSTTLRRAAQTLMERRPTERRSSPMPFLSELTSGRWQTLAPTPDGMALQNGKKRALLSQPAGQEHPDADLAWLAVRLAYAQRLNKLGAGFPLVLLADPLLDSPYAATVFNALRSATESGVQCLLLSSNQQIANQLTEAGAPSVRVGLRPGDTRDASQPQGARAARSQLANV